MTDTPTPKPLLSPTPTPTREASAPSLSIGSVEYAVEVTATSGERAMGLSGRQMLSPRTGMLFVYPPGMAPAFWMREMLIPLDFVWIGEGCEVVDITPDVPPPATGTPNSELSLYRSSVAATYTFEINAGEAERLGVHVGDSVSFTGIAESVSEAEC